MTDIAAIDPILQRIAWIQTAMAELNRYQNENIEGIHGGNLESIALDIAAIQDQIRTRFKCMRLVTPLSVTVVLHDDEIIFGLRDCERII